MSMNAGFHPFVWFCRVLLRLVGWRILLPPTLAAKAVVMIYPHTSNWDFILGILFRYGSGLPIHWAAKDSLFRGLPGVFFRAMGGVPVNRRERTGFVEQMAANYANHERFYLGITPEGTRSTVDHLKSGFYRLARAIDVPLALACIDYARREVGIFGLYETTGDEAADLAALAAAYRGRRGKYPAQQGPFVFIDMDQAWRERGGV
ncbi:MAG: 1-acyl-sn-glycerol-3-phosphate acyltransferase [Sterolibacterium sp.]|jgi:1-acyl-sn-glycerol-3-phosphate acyltransferase|nr:1-acyl-sn-glycerol-3-phosphate acyltransferase [Sterolibacterium sp.]